jgi:subtilisin-like proprotein convertase family protein/endonuclease/exonuclease/phosphatase family metal-dependent hydrolase
MGTRGSRAWCVVAAILAAATVPLTAAAQRLKESRYAIRDAGAVRSFVVADDEVHVFTAARQHFVRKIPTMADTESVRQFADALKRSTGEDVELVLYEEGRPRNAFTRRVLTKKILVRLADSADAAALARAAGAQRVRAVDYAPGWQVFAASETGGALDMAERLRALPGVLAAEPLLAKQQRKKFTPNDTLFAEQWHLRNTGQNGGTAGIDVNITNVWDTYRGTNILVAIVDDGLQTTHTDLVGNVNTTIDYDFNGGDGSPNPDVSQDYHGTACAGVCAGKGHNGRGISGAAPEAKLVGLRLIGGPATDQDEADAMTHSNALIHIKSNSWGPDDDGLTLAGPGTLTAAALRSSVTNGRAGKGAIFVWAAGNGDDADDNANYDGYGNSIYTIAIGAVSDQGLKASYSEPGACVVVSAPSSSFNPDTQGITTTDLMGNNGYNYAGAPGELSDTNYTKTFGGTSSACPLAAGVIALMLQANTNLGWRDVQEILIRTARKIETNSAEWINNGAGIHFNHNYGAGLLDARAAVNMALTWTNLGAQVSFASAQSNLSLSIPDNSATGVTRTFSLSNVQIRVEHVTLTVDITHANRGDLTVTLISPNNTTSMLAELHGDTGNDYAQWAFMSVRDWGEQAAGTWTVKVADRRSANAGTLGSLRLEVFGTQTIPNAPPVLGNIGNKVVTTSNTLSFAVTATDPDGDAITLTVSNKPGGVNSGLGSTNGNGAFHWTNASPAGVYTCSFHAAATGGSDSETITITVSNPPPGGAAANVWINEIHYDNASTDVGEGVEIAGAAGTDLSSYSVILYDGGAGGTYGSNALSGSIDNEGCGFGALWFPISGLQNGAPDGVALVRNGSQVVQLLAYEGIFLASGGPAAGLTAADVGVSEKGTEAAGRSLQLRGSGTNYAQFAWAGPTNASLGSLNSGQAISFCGGQPPVLAAIGNKTVTLSNILQFAVAATDANGNAITLSVTSKPALATAVFSATNGSGTFTWTNPAPVGVYTSAFYASDVDGAVTQTITITVSAPSTAAVAGVWINELHYDNTGSDVNEGVEIAGAAGTALTNYSLLFYDGGAGTVYKTTALSGTLDEEGCGYGAVWFSATAMQNGAPDGVALVRNGTSVVQFLSYEGSFTASAGAAAGQTSADLGVFEAGSEPVDRSVQLKGTGNAYNQFAWGGSTNPASRGTLNAGQAISGCGSSPTPSARFGITNFVMDENAGALNVPIALSSAAGCTVRVAVAGTAAAGSDFTISSTNLVFSGGATQQIVTVTVSDDAVSEIAESISLTLTNLSGATTASAKRVDFDLRDNDAFSIMTANLSQQTDACSSVYSDPAARIFRGLKPDIAAVQEFVVTNFGGHGSYVSNNFGTNYQYWVEDESDPCGIPNGIVSRYPITNSGEWADGEPGAGYRDFVWADIDLPGPHNLHVVSVHLSQSGGPSARQNEARALTNYIALANYPADDYVVICGDLNATDRNDAVVQILSAVGVDTHQPADQLGDKDSNSSRNEDFDFILPETALDQLHQPITNGGFTFTNGMVFDSAVWASPPPPIITNDSHAVGVQHMAVMKLFSMPPLGGEQVWINELHFDNTGADEGEGVEVAGTSGTSLTNYYLLRYGPGGALVSAPNSNRLAGVLGDPGCGIGASWTNLAGLQNGTAGVALVRGTSLVQFLSHKGTITGSVGAAAGVVSVDIGVHELTSTPLGQSLQLAGSGDSYAQFTWVGPTNMSTGTLNAAQSILPCTSGSPPVLHPIGGKSVNLTNTLQFGVSASPTDGDTVTLSVSNSPGGSFSSTNEIGTFTWSPATPAGVYTMTVYAVDNDGTDSEAVVIHVLNPPPGGVGTIWINELHYNNTGNDTNEGLEVAGKAGITLTNYALVRYEGSNGKTNGTTVLTGAIDYESCGFGAVWVPYPPDGLENGMEGVALVRLPTQVIHFISYGGSFTASNGVADGLVSEDVGVNETNPPPAIGQTLYLTGSGTNFSQFAWTGPSVGSTGSLNAGQSISPCGGDGPGPFGQPHLDGIPGSPPALDPIGNKFVLLGSDLYFDLHAEEEDGDPVTLSIENPPAGSGFTSNDVDGQFSWVAAGPEGVYTTAFHAADVNGTDSETITITVATWIPPPGALAYYNFDGGAAFTAGAYYVAGSLAASNVLVGNGSLAGDSGNPNFAARGGGWTTTTNYFEFTLVVTDGYAAVVNGLQFDDRSASQGPTTWQLRSGSDGYASNLALGSTHAAFGTTNAAIRSPVLTGTNVFRVYGSGGTLLNATWKLDNVLLSGAVLPAGQDAEPDGMPDIWEIAQFGDADTEDAASDFDEDGVLDPHEYVAGTDARSDASYLRVLSPEPGTGGAVVVSWPSESNRLYRIARSTDLLAGFGPVATNIPATPPINVRTDTPPASPVLLYRIEVE